ncbi:MAG: cbb3-type cytochrome oxidase assembly protein CcoS [Steroidobacteraceae bacterium]|nr:cbb3-type cytochrome oxidase assembly protein CcoS [Steroidobacteraceae bacterium]
MNILVVLIPLSILLLVGAGIAFFWAVDHGQFDDMDTPRLMPLLDNPHAPANVLTTRSAEPTGSAPLTASDAHSAESAHAERPVATERGPT